MTLQKLSIIVPAYNEEKNLLFTIQAIMQWPYDKEIIIIDDGSKDDTAEIIKSLQKQSETVKGVFLSKNEGKGHALLKGVSLATGDILLFLDADLRQTANKAIQLIDPILEDKADMTIAKFPPAKKKGGFGLVKNLATYGILLYTGFRPSAPLSGQRAMKKEVMGRINNLSAGYGIEVGLTIDVIRKGYRIKEVEIPLNHRETGRNLQGFIHRGKQFVAVVNTLVTKIKY